MDRKTIFKIVVIFLISFFGSILLQQLFKVDLHTIRSLVDYFGPAAPIAYSVLLFLGLTIPLNPISDLLVVSLASLLFSPLVSVSATFITHLAALTANYFVGRSFLELFLQKILSKNEVEKIEDLSYKINLRWIFGLRFLLPLTAIGIDAVSYASGLANLNFWKFLLVSMIPWTIFNILYFYSSGYLREINPALIVVPIGLLVGIPALFLAARHQETLKEKISQLVKKPFNF